MPFDKWGVRLELKGFVWKDHGSCQVQMLKMGGIAVDIVVYQLSFSLWSFQCVCVCVCVAAFRHAPNSRYISRWGCMLESLRKKLKKTNISGWKDCNLQRLRESTALLFIYERQSPEAVWTQLSENGWCLCVSRVLMLQGWKSTGSTDIDRSPPHNMDNTVLSAFKEKLTSK